MLPNWTFLGVQFGNIEQFPLNDLRDDTVYV